MGLSVKKDPMNLPLAKPSFGPEEIQRIAEVLESGRVTQGPWNERFEIEFASWIGCGSVQNLRGCAVNSCTSGLHATLLGLGVGPGDEVLVPAFTFVATANAVEQTGATPVFVDTQPDTFNIDPRDAEKRLSARTRAMLPVHQFGLVADMQSLLSIAQLAEVALVEDCACAAGSRLDGQLAGAWGVASVFSFHPRKVLTTGEGGMILTSDPDLLERVRCLRNQGASPAQGLAMPAVEVCGYNYRLTELQAAIGVCQLERAEALIRERQLLAQAYDCALADLDWLATPHIPEDSMSNYQSYVVRILPGAPENRDTIMVRLQASNIATRQGTHAVPTLDYYARKYRLNAANYPGALEAQETTLALPLFPGMTEPQVEHVVAALAMTGTNRNGGSKSTPL
ncbi:MAG: hypothetical protein CMJ48_06255 [Planctomycetaceae bacterium]|nr:hypothetical protein [Planctomycetaceae bacterium]